MKPTGYNLREGAIILAARRAEREREEQVRQCQIRAGYARFLDRKLADARRAA